MRWALGAEGPCLMSYTKHSAFCVWLPLGALSLMSGGRSASWRCTGSLNGPLFVSRVFFSCSLEQKKVPSKSLSHSGLARRRLRWVASAAFPTAPVQGW